MKTLSRKRLLLPRPAIPIRPCLLERWGRAALWDGARLQLLRQSDPGFHHLRAGGDFEIAVARQPRLITAAVVAEGLRVGHVADAAVGQRHREGEREAAALLLLQAEGAEVF